MTRTLTLIVAIAFAVSLGTSADAKSCRDAKGKFVKCPPAATATAPAKCRDAKGKFAKCSAPGAKPATK